MQHYISDFDLSKEELQDVLHKAKNLKETNGSTELDNKVLTALFYNSSLRTMMSFQYGMEKLGGIAESRFMDNSRTLEYEANTVMDGKTKEHIKEFVEVLSAYSDVLAIRKSDLIPDDKDGTEGQPKLQDKLTDEFFEQVLDYVNVPLINMESNMFHPCQSLADMMTIQEHFSNFEDKKFVLTWTPHPKPLPVATPHSQMSMPSIFGMDVVLACPPEFKLKDEVIQKAKQKAKKNGGSLTIEHEQKQAVKDADIVCAKSWVSLKHFGEWEQEQKARSNYKDWEVTSETMNATDSAKFLHCMPIRRNVIASDDIVESENALIIPEAENRMWSQMGLLAKLLS